MDHNAKTAVSAGQRDSIERATMNKLSLDGVGRSYGDIHALHPTHLDIGDGEFIVILGPSGSGKSTLLKLIAGFDHSTCGRIILDGMDITRMPAHRRTIGMVFQNYALFPHLTVYGNIAFPLAVRGDKRSGFENKVSKALELVGLEGFQKRKISAMSGGQQQRVALARALVFEPSLLLLDEPLSALDKQLRERMQVELRRIHRKVGATFIGVTHDQREALTMADRVVVMNEGRIEQVGTPTEIYYRPTHRFVAEFVGEVTIFDGQVRHSEPYGDSAFGAVLVSGLGEIYGFDYGGECPKGSTASVMVRPEFVRIKRASEVSEADVTKTNRLAGVVDHVEFSGEFLELTVLGADGTIIKAKELSSGNSDCKWQSGEEVFAEWSCKDTTILKAEKD